MLAINHRLGFREYGRDASYQIGPDALDRWLISRGVAGAKRISC